MKPTNTESSWFFRSTVLGSGIHVAGMHFNDEQPTFIHLKSSFHSYSMSFVI